MKILYPKFDQKEGVMWPFVKKLLQSSFLLWELVVNLSDVHRLQIWVTVAGVGLANMYKQVFVELQRHKYISCTEHSLNIKHLILSVAFVTVFFNTLVLISLSYHESSACDVLLCTFWVLIQLKEFL